VLGKMKIEQNSEGKREESHNYLEERVPSSVQKLQRKQQACHGSVKERELECC
jgi:hypothetical protein